MRKIGGEERGNLVGKETAWIVTVPMLPSL